MGARFQQNLLPLIEPGLPASGFFLGRVEGIAVDVPREEAMQRLAPAHRDALELSGLGNRVFATAEQVHGAEIAILKEGNPLPVFPVEGADGLATNRLDVVLGIYVADCAAVAVIDRAGRAIALVHSGKKGTEAGIVPRAVHALREHFGILPADLAVRVSPCIRPPHYETDFASEIARQACEAGVVDFKDCGLCTASDPDRFYSYRMEKGRTGRMLAALALPEPPAKVPTAI